MLYRYYCNFICSHIYVIRNGVRGKQKIWMYIKPHPSSHLSNISWSSWQKINHIFPTKAELHWHRIDYRCTLCIKRIIDAWNMKEHVPKSLWEWKMQIFAPTSHIFLMINFSYVRHRSLWLIWFSIWWYFTCHLIPCRTYVIARTS